MGIKINQNSTIVAITTPIGVGGVSIVRISGKKSISTADKLFVSLGKKRPSEFKSRELVLGTFTGKAFKENCLCVVFRNPNSFTGEDVVEFQCHGGIKVTNMILEECLKNGCKLAQNGEFSFRAFMNGKMNLSEAEGMIDIINAETETELNVGYDLMSGGLTAKIQVLQDDLVDIMSDIEVSFDYPEEDLEYKTIPEITSRLEKVKENITNLVNTGYTGSIIKNGINVVIVGRPNVGKSSILNALLRFDKAIVTDIAGTTRDIVEDRFEVNGIKVNIIDTAGIRETEDVIEKIGVERSRSAIKKADIVLFVIDNSEKLTQKDREIFELIKNKKYIVIANKCDKKQVNTEFPNAIKVSAKTNDGIDNIKQTIYNLVIDKNVLGNGTIITNQRHIECLKEAEKNIIDALKVIKTGTLDLVSIDLNNAYSNLGEITGTTTNEKILDSIFKKFCLGK